MAVNEAFTFGYECDDQGSPVFGDGSDEDPFFIAISSKGLMHHANRESDKFVMHFDATFKTNQCDYPVFVCGISDASRAFHLVAVCVESANRARLHASSG